jgi:hypothetical protein
MSKVRYKKFVVYDAPGTRPLINWFDSAVRKNDLTKIELKVK